MTKPCEIRRSGFLGLALVVLVTAFALGGGVSADAAPRGPRVVCITDSYPPTSRYAHTPRKCVIHEKGEPYAGYSMVALKGLRWKYWRPGQARAKGNIVLNMYGPAPLKLKLRKPRKRCGEKVFTQAVGRYKTHFGGDTHTTKFKVRLDDCLRG